MWKLAVTVLCLAYLANASPQKAIAVLRNPSTGIDGVIHFEETADGILITGNITGLKAGPHGFHIHEKGDVSDPKCVSAGPHFNPFNKTHGGPEDQQRHVGDLGNIHALANRTTDIRFLDRGISFEGKSNIMGRALVIHADGDDFGRGDFNDSNTTGHAGARIACGVITKSAASQLQLSIFLLTSCFIILLTSRK